MTKDDLNSLAWPAMRYALGRKTFVVDTVCRALMNNINSIRKDIKLSMAKEIEKAIANNEAGMDMDVRIWQEIANEFNKKESG